ncbi:MAG: (2Fe-2S)-binding protein [Candidatus Bathyarchaeia archaeon]|jgi:aerobic-type carbon monoxide dehydrogenase small subunit (CoxS/CutS family)
MGKELKVNVKVNDRRYKRTVEPRMLLVDFLRDELGLTGTHIGCDTGHCGACTVMLNGVTVKSCLLLATQANNSEVKTIEGVAVNGKLHPLQEAFLEQQALQCGYCTPGMILSCLFLLQRNPRPTDEEIRKGIGGNLCRCTGYLNIVKAVKAASAKMK